MKYNTNFVSSELSHQVVFFFLTYSELDYEK